MILEAFKPGTAPPDNYAVVGYGNSGDRRWPPHGRSLRHVPPDADRAVRSGTGGLY